MLDTTIWHTNTNNLQTKLFVKVYDTNIRSSIVANTTLYLRYPCSDNCRFIRLAPYPYQLLAGRVWFINDLKQNSLIHQGLIYYITIISHFDRIFNYTKFSVMVIFPYSPMYVHFRILNWSP